MVDHAIMEAARDEILQWAKLAPCHVTGEHTPEHHLHHENVCLFQKDELFKELLGLLGLTLDDFGRALHGDNCYWCHNGGMKAHQQAWVEAKP